MIPPLSLTTATGSHRALAEHFHAKGGNNFQSLREPVTVRQNLTLLQGSQAEKYFEGLIQENIIGRNKNNPKRGTIIASEVRALINSLSDGDKIKLAEVVKALEPDKDKIKGAIWSGGEIRVVPETAGTMIVNVILELLGRAFPDNEPLKFIGTSAGSYQALGAATRAPNSCTLRETTDTDFRRWYNRPEKVEQWARTILQKGINAATGREVQDGTIINTNDLAELGTDLEVVTGRKMLGLLPFPGVLLLPEDAPKINVDPEDISLERLVWATSNHPLLYPRTWTNCTLTNNAGENLIFIDNGIFGKYLLYIEAVRREILEYAKNRDQKPGFYFLIGHRMPLSQKPPDRIFGQRASSFKVNVGRQIHNAIQWVDTTVNGEITKNIEDLGIGRAYMEVSCEANDPYEGNLLGLTPGNFDVPMEIRQALIMANLPTKEFAESTMPQERPFEPVLDQLHRNLVHPTKTAYELYLDDINDALGISGLPIDEAPEQARQSWLARVKSKAAIF